MAESNLLALLSELMEVEPTTLSMNTSLPTLTAWNSLNFMYLLTTLEEYYRTNLELGQLLQCTTPHDILSLVQPV